MRVERSVVWLLALLSAAAFWALAFGAPAVTLP